ncbi:uncharacterized protein LOC119405210 [Rhipicephalus sanguineus]|uniref:Uncharacterized protein n=1 Tax=Rhipicephalus sanguineus TaxID=34632 RepID=A0A9D4PAM1_RHISA|nr:uncharacterized protein LOC119405210 [Rhipicephalus sanguineus]KAH7935255.1 hypothetical protein HPB52_004954 [Rhipicephalus sanguineus]
MITRHPCIEHLTRPALRSSRHFASGDGTYVRPPDTRLSTRGVESRLPGWIPERDLREAGCSKGTQAKLSPAIRSCPGSRPSKTARLQRKTTAVTATAEAMPYRRRSYEDNFVNRQSQELARLSLAEEREEDVVSGDGVDDDDEEMNGAEDVPFRKAAVVYADGDGDATTMDLVLDEQREVTSVSAGLAWLPQVRRASPKRTAYSTRPGAILPCGILQTIN